MADTKTTSTTTAPRRTDTSDSGTQPKTSTNKATTAPASRIEQRDRAGFLGNASPIDPDATPATTFAGNDVDDAYEISPETHGPHDRTATGDI